jgi:hypothetical protein
MKMKSTINKVPSLRDCTAYVAIFLFLFGCEGMKEKIDIDMAEFPPKIAVSASLDTDMGTFNMRLYEGLPIVSYDRYQSEYMQVHKYGSVLLYCDEKLIWSLNGTFDLSVNKIDYGDGRNIYREITVTGLPVNAGSVYRLEIDIAGYQKAVATTVMPDPPEVSELTVDLVNLVKKQNINGVTGMIPEGYFYPVTCTLSDNSPDERNYYYIQLLRHQTSNDPAYYEYLFDIEHDVGVGIANSAILQDNPNMEARISLLDDMNNYDLFWFNALLLSDLTFSGKSVMLDLYGVFSYDYQDPSIRPERPDYYNPVYHGPEIIVENKRILKVGHISADMFRHYRSLVLQENGLGFFTEPVMIVSNVENGYGCFSLLNSLTIVLNEYQTYFYPQWQMFY